MDPATAMAVFATSKDSAELLIFIVTTVKKVRRLKKECLEIGKLAKFLQDILDDGGDALKQLRSEDKLRSQLLEVALFVANCTKSTKLLDRVWEVLWEKKLPRLLSTMKDWIVILTMESSAKALQGQKQLVEGQQQLLIRTSVLKDVKDTVDDVQSGVGSLTIDINDLRKQAEDFHRTLLDKQLADAHKSATWNVDFTATNERLLISKDGSGQWSGKLNGQAVVALPISTSAIDSRSGPRVVALYSRLSATTLVHRFYGVAQRGQTLLAVMQDLGQSKSLRECIGLESFADLPDRIRMAYDVAQTMAYLHSVDILVRSLSDDRIIMYQDEGRWKPILTNLDTARLFLEDTSDHEVDVRFEAPEYDRTKRHNVATDIWSFGVLLWEWAALSYPFEHAEVILPNSAPDEATKIRKTLHSGKVPWQAEQGKTADSLLLHVISLVRSCCSVMPSQRPPMAAVAQSLFVILSCGDILTPDTTSTAEDVKFRVKKGLDTFDGTANAQNAQGCFSGSDVQLLQSLAHNGDAIASAILGAGVYRGMITLQGDSGHDPTPAGADQDANVIRRAKGAIPYLDFAVEAGFKESSKDLRDAHRRLAEHYDQLRKDFKKSL